MKHIRMLMAALAVLLLGSALIPAPAEAAWVNPFPRVIRFAPFGEDSSLPAAYTRSVFAPNANPLGSNDWNCHPSSKHPYPVVLVHGTAENAYANWNGLSPILKDQGYCVYALNFGNSTGIPFLNATGDIPASAVQIGTFVDRVRASTGAAKVDLIGHSQGGSVARYYANLIGKTTKVRQVIAITPSNHATTASGITDFGKLLGIYQDQINDGFNWLSLPAFAQQTDPNSTFFKNLNGNGETISGMSYTNIISKYDEVVTPYTQGKITAGPGATVDNITLQSVCLNDLSEHLSAPYSKNVAQIILNKLDPSDQHAIFCYGQAPITGNTQAFG